jgi:hypothetical protein
MKWRCRACFETIYLYPSLDFQGAGPSEPYFPDVEWSWQAIIIIISNYPQCDILSFIVVYDIQTIDENVISHLQIISGIMS